MSDWSSQQVLQFLELYQAEPVIWDPYHINHKDKKKINDAWGRLSEKLKVPIKELKTKKDILMGTFRRHLRKKQESTRSGAGSDDIYEPIWFAYSLMESFLLPVYTTRNTLNTETGPSTSQISKETSGGETSRELHETFGDGTTEIEEMETVSSPATPTEKTRSILATKKRRCPAPDTVEQQMATAFGQLTNALGQRQSHPTPTEDDDCDLYAKLLAKKLRELSKDERKLYMYEIDGIFVSKIRCRLSRRETPSPQYSNPYSRPPTASTPYSRPPELNTYIPDRPSSVLSSYSEPIANIYASNRPIQFSVQPPSVQSTNTYSVQPPSVQSTNTYSVQPPSVQSTNTYSVQPPSVQSTNTYSVQPPSVQSTNTFSIQSASVQFSDIHSVQTPTVQSPPPVQSYYSPETETNIALSNSLETFESNERSDQ